MREVSSPSRHEGYFRLEWDLADQRTHMIARNHAFIVPVCLDATSEINADTHESFQRVQWTRLPGGATASAFVERVRRLLAPAGVHMPAPGHEDTRPPSAATPAANALAPASWWKSGPAIMAAIVILGAAVYCAIDKPWISKPSVSSSPYCRSST